MSCFLIARGNDRRSDLIRDTYRGVHALARNGVNEHLHGLCTVEPLRRTSIDDNQPRAQHLHRRSHIIQRASDDRKQRAITVLIGFHHRGFTANGLRLPQPHPALDPGRPGRAVAHIHMVVPHHNDGTCQRGIFNLRSLNGPVRKPQRCNARGCNTRLSITHTALSFGRGLSGRGVLACFPQKIVVDFGRMPFASVRTAISTPRILPVPRPIP